jgi:hypothetical protein
MANTAKACIGYLLSIEIADDVFMGGAMVTDSFGLPLEFRYTDPVRATKLQKVLYGGVLETYIQTDVVLSGLLDSLEQKPPLYVVNDLSFVPVLDAKGRVAIFLSEAHSQPLAEMGASNIVSPSEIMIQLTATGGPMRVHCAPGHASESPAAKSTKQAEIIKTIVEAAKTMDVTEPLRRVEKALRMVWDEALANEDQGAQE